MYFSSGRKVPKAHRGGQSVHEGVAAPDPTYPNGLRAHPWGAALMTPRGGDTQSMGGALKRHHIQHASSTGSLAWGLSLRRRRGFAPAGATKGLCDRPLETFASPTDEFDWKSRSLRVAARPSRAVTPAKENTRSGIPARVSRGPKALRGVSKGAAPLWRESRGQRPLVGSRGKPLALMKTSAPVPRISRG